LVKVLRKALSSEPTNQLNTAAVMTKGVQTKRPASRYFLIGMKTFVLLKISGKRNRRRMRLGACCWMCRRWPCWLWLFRQPQRPPQRPGPMCHPSRL
jgi:hypothetical protein